MVVIYWTFDSTRWYCIRLRYACNLDYAMPHHTTSSRNNVVYFYSNSFAMFCSATLYLYGCIKSYRSGELCMCALYVDTEMTLRHLPQIIFINLYGVLFLYEKKNARAILDQIIQQLLYPILVSAQVRWGAHLWRRRRVQNEWTWIYIHYLMYNLKTQCDDGGGRGDGSRAKGKMCCLIWNQWHPFSFFDMDHWNDASHK